MTNYTRWAGLKESWDHRIAMMARHIRKGSTVLDLGAGKQALRAYLPEGCSYQACDLVARDAETIVCDFNKNQAPPLLHYDYVFCSGLMEYICDIPAFIATITLYSDRFLISYAVKLKGQDIAKRRKRDWINDYALSELIEVFHNNDLQIRDLASIWGQRIFYLEKKEMDAETRSKNRRQALRKDWINTIKNLFHITQPWASSETLLD